MLVASGTYVFLGVLCMGVVGVASSSSNLLPKCWNVEETYNLSKVPDGVQCEGHWKDGKAYLKGQVLYGYGPMDGTTYFVMAFVKMHFETTLKNYTSDGHLCFFQRGWYMSKKLPTEKNNFQVVSLDQFTINETIFKGYDYLLKINWLFLTESLQELSYEMAENSLPAVIYKSNSSFQQCNDLFTVGGNRDYLVLAIVPLITDINMTFVPAFINSSSILLQLFNEKNVLENLSVHGGEDWGNPGFILRYMKSLRFLDLSSNGIDFLQKGIIWQRDFWTLLLIIQYYQIL